MPTVATILAQSAICQYLAIGEHYKKLALKGGAIVSIERVGRLIYICRKTLEFIYSKDPNDANLIPTANYLYWLCGKYNSAAAAIISGGGTGAIINPSTGTQSTVQGYYLEFTVGDVGAPIVDGQSSFIIPLSGFIENSIHSDIGGAELPQYRIDQMSANPDYSNPAQVTINFNAPVSNGMFFQFRGLRLQAVATPAPSESSFEVATYAAMLLMATGPYKLDFLVIDDENKGQQNTMYTYWPGQGIREWIAAVEDL